MAKGKYMYGVIQELMLKHQSLSTLKLDIYISKPIVWTVILEFQIYPPVALITGADICLWRTTLLLEAVIWTPCLSSYITICFTLLLRLSFEKKKKITQIHEDSHTSLSSFLFHSIIYKSLKNMVYLSLSSYHSSNLLNPLSPHKWIM